LVHGHMRKLEKHGCQTGRTWLGTNQMNDLEEPGTAGGLIE
jgi:hypothetical protein